MLDRLRRVGADIASLLGLRVELFGIELREQLDRWLRVVVLAVAAVVLGCIGLGFVAVLVTVAFWEHQPLIALGVFCLLFLGAAAWCAGQLSQLVSQGTPAFDQTISEFRRDWDSIRPREPADAAPTSAGSGSAVAATGARAPGDETRR